MQQLQCNCQKEFERENAFLPELRPAIGPRLECGNKHFKTAEGDAVGKMPFGGENA